MQGVVVGQWSIIRIHGRPIGESVTMRFKTGDLVIDRRRRRRPGTYPREGMVYKVTTDTNGRQWYELQFFGSGETVEWVDSFAHKYLELYKAEDNENKDI